MTLEGTRPREHFKNEIEACSAQCAIFIALPKVRRQFATGSAQDTTARAICRCSRDLPGPDGSDRTHGARRRARARRGALGMPGPPQYGGAPVTNIRNLSSPHWRDWLGRGNRCLVPATSFCEYADTKPRKTPIWFALGEDRPLFAFAGLWTPWQGVRGAKNATVSGRHELFGFLATVANAIVAPIHPKAMPAILTAPDDFDRWLQADTLDALAFQRPLPDDAIRILAKGEKEDKSLEFSL